MENLWPSFSEYPIEENLSVSILQEQARIIKKETNNIIRATCSKLSYKSGPLSAATAIGQMIGAMSSTMYEEDIDEEVRDKEDVNDLFAVTKYKFEIYNDEYKFRLFVLNYSELFPISLDVDGGILEEISYENLSRIYSNSELKEIVRDIFGSNKVHTVINRMLQKSKNESE